MEKVKTPEQQPEETGNAGAVEVPETVVVKYKGDEQTLSLKKPEDITKLTQWAQKGHAYDQLTPEYKKAKILAQQAEAWNSLIADAKTNDESFHKLVSFVEDSTGRKLTAKEKKDLLEDADPAMQEITQLKRELAALKNQGKEKELQQQTQQIIARMQDMAAKPDKYPGFDLEEVYEKMVEFGISDPEIVYHHIKKDHIVKSQLESEIAKVKAEYEKMLNKRKAAFTETDNSPAGLAPKEPLKARNWDEMSNKIMEKLNQQGMSLES